VRRFQMGLWLLYSDGEGLDIIVRVSNFRQWFARYRQFYGVLRWPLTRWRDPTPAFLTG
jgi:hypothetical protein